MARRIYAPLTIAASMMPLMAAAVTVEEIISTLQAIVDVVIPLLSVVAIAVFIYGVVLYITASGDAEKEKAARRYLIAGLIGLFVLVAFWALVTVLTDTFGLSESTAPINPDIGAPVG